MDTNTHGHAHTLTHKHTWTQTHMYMHTHTVYIYHAPSNIHITWRYIPAGCVLVPTKDEYLTFIASPREVAVFASIALVSRDLDVLLILTSV